MTRVSPKLKRCPSLNNIDISSKSNSHLFLLNCNCQNNKNFDLGSQSTIEISEWDNSTQQLLHQESHEESLHDQLHYDEGPNSFSGTVFTISDQSHEDWISICE